MPDLELVSSLDEFIVHDNDHEVMWRIPIAHHFSLLANYDALMRIFSEVHHKCERGGSYQEITCTKRQKELPLSEKTEKLLTSYKPKQLESDGTRT